VLDISFFLVFVPFMFLLVSLVVRNLRVVWQTLRQAQGERDSSQEARIAE
jgi:TRAP-type C4-dicarboxylate transport system permease small subunit